MFYMIKKDIEKSIVFYVKKRGKEKTKKRGLKKMW